MSLKRTADAKNLIRLNCYPVYVKPVKKGRFLPALLTGWLISASNLLQLMPVMSTLIIAM